MIGTHLPGWVRNVSLAASNALTTLFEAVSNSIHAIEETGRAPDEGRIRIEVPKPDVDPGGSFRLGTQVGLLVPRRLLAPV